MGYKLGLDDVSCWGFRVLGFRGLGFRVAIRGRFGVKDL